MMFISQQRKAASLALIRRRLPPVSVGRRSVLPRPATGLSDGRRQFFLPSSIVRRTFTSSEKSTIPVTYVEQNGEERVVQAEIGKNLLETAHDNNIELEGACGGELACSTCHLVFEKDMYDQLPEKKDEEDDMLDLAQELTDTSRLGCQIRVEKYMAGMKVRIPDDGF